MGSSKKREGKKTLSSLNPETTNNYNNEKSAIKSLGPLFTLTQISLWDDDDAYAYSTHNYNQHYSSVPKHTRFKYDDDTDDDNDDGAVKISPNASLNTTEGLLLGKDGSAFEEMSALGLPLSFRTNRQKSRQIKVKSEMAQSTNSPKRRDKNVQESCKSNEEKPYCEDLQLKSRTSSSSLPDQSENCGCGFNNNQDTARLLKSSERHMPTDMAATLIFDGPEEHANDSSSLNQPADAVIIDDSVGDDMPMEVEMMHVDGISNLPTITTSSACNLLDGHLEDDMSLTGQLNAQGSSTLQQENSDFATIEQSDLSEESQNMSVLAQDDETGICWGTCGDWSAYWDTLYLRYYFFNAQTKESTWYPPEGMETFASGDGCCPAIESNDGLSGTNVGSLRDRNEEVQSVEYENGDIHSAASIMTQLSNASSSTFVVQATHGEERDTIVNDRMMEASVGTIQTTKSTIMTQLSNASSSTFAVQATHAEEGDTIVNDHMMEASVGTIQTTKSKCQRSKKSVNDDETSEFYQDEERYTNVKKYWFQRYLLFSRFDDGIMMDEEGWFSVTPESIAKHHASRCGEGIIVDCFTGVGGNAIQFAKTFKHVIAIDIDPDKLDFAYHNATIYGVQDNIDFVLGDSLSVAPKLKVDSVFLSPPWGGPNYVKAKPYSLHMLQPYDGKFLFETFKIIAPKIIMFLPRHVDFEELAELALSANPPWALEIEKNFLNGHLKAVTAYFSKVSL